MSIKYFVDEPDVGQMDLPLKGVLADTHLFDTHLFDTLQEAEKHAEQHTALNNGKVFFCAWAYDDESGACYNPDR